MATQTFDIGSPLERLMNDRRVRIGGAIAGALIILTSMIVVNVSNEPSRAKATKAVAVLPDVPLNIPILRYWPYPETRRVEASAPGTRVSVRAPAGKPARRVLTARR